MVTISMFKIKYLLCTILVCIVIVGWQPAKGAEPKIAFDNPYSLQQRSRWTGRFSIYSEEFLTQISEMMNSTLPMMIEENVQWDSSHVGPGKTLNYNYTMLDYSASQLDPKMFVDSIRHHLKYTVCTAPETRMFPTNGVLLNFNYYDRDGRLITTVEVAPNDCKTIQSNKYSVM